MSAYEVFASYVDWIIMAGCWQAVAKCKPSDVSDFSEFMFRFSKTKVNLGRPVATTLFVTASVALDAPE
jgi:hypothetical protein